MNRLPGTIPDHGLASDYGLQIDAGPDDGAVPGQRGVVVFPHTAVSVFLTPKHGSPRNAFSVTITVIEAHGNQIRVHSDGLSAGISRAAVTDLGLTPGMTFYFVIKATAMKIYPL